MFWCKVFTQISEFVQEANICNLRNVLTGYLRCLHLSFYPNINLVNLKWLHQEEIKSLTPKYPSQQPTGYLHRTSKFVQKEWTCKLSLYSELQCKTVAHSKLEFELSRQTQSYFIVCCDSSSYAQDCLFH